MRGPEPDGVNPTARWMARGLWKGAMVIVLFLLIGGIVEALR
jgi:hypothetical protein